MRIGARLPIAARICRVENRNLISILPFFDSYIYTYRNSRLRASLQLPVPHTHGMARRFRSSRIPISKNPVFLFSFRKFSFRDSSINLSGLSGRTFASRFQRSSDYFIVAHHLPLVCRLFSYRSFHFRLIRIPRAISLFPRVIAPRPINIHRARSGNKEGIRGDTRPQDVAATFPTGLQPFPSLSK